LFGDAGEGCPCLHSSLIKTLFFHAAAAAKAEIMAHSVAFVNYGILFESSLCQNEIIIRE
jgi:hypothetical protein